MAPRVSLLLGACLLSITLHLPVAFQFGPPRSSIPPPSSPSSNLNANDNVVFPSIAENAIHTAKNFISALAITSSIAFFATNPPPPAHAVSPDDTSRTIKIELNSPVLLKRIQTKSSSTELFNALREVQEVIGPDAIKVLPPSNIPGATRDLLSGKGEIKLNGKPVDVAVVSSEKGEITVKVSNFLIPKIPLFLTGAGADGDLASGEDGSVLERVARVYGFDFSTPLFDQKFLGGKYGIPIPSSSGEESGGTFTTYVPTNKDVVGATSLILGVAYGSSYAYYDSLIKAKEKEAEEKAAAKKAMAKEKKAAK